MSARQKNKKNETYEEKLATKKAAVLGTEKRSSKPLVYMALGLGVVILAVLGIFALDKEAGTARSVALVEQVRHPVKLFDDGKARYFQLDTREGLTIKYFVLKSKDGVIRAAFDACDVCWPEGKGYFQDGDVMVCRNCGQRFASVKVNEVKGGCNPAPLERKIVGDSLIIRVKDVLQGSPYFDFSKRS